MPKDLDPYISCVEREGLIKRPLLLALGTQVKEEGLVPIKTIISIGEKRKKHEWFIYYGGHTWIYWREIMSYVLKFHVGSSRTRDVTHKLHSSNTTKKLSNVNPIET